MRRDLRSVNPKAQVRVIWLNEWSPNPRANAMPPETGDVTAAPMCWPFTPAHHVLVVVQERGKYVVVYHSDMRKFALIVCSTP